VTALVTGGTGFVGAHVVRALLAVGRRVRCLIRPSSDLRNLDGLDVEYVTGDLTDVASVRGAVAGCDVVFHGAADYRLFARDPAELYRNNVDGTRNVLTAAAEARVQRVVYTSSVATLAPSADGVPVDETAAASTSLDDMVGDYKRSKFLAEREVLAASAGGLPVVVVNPSTPVGDGDIKPTPTGQIIVDFLNGRMPAYVDTGLNLVDVRDVAAGHLLAAEAGRPGERYILANQNLTLKQVLDTLARLSGRPAPRVRLPHWLPLAIAHVETPIARWLGRAPRVPLDGVRMSRKRMFFDGSKAVRELGMPQSPIEAALRRAVDWFSQRGYVRAASDAAVSEAGDSAS
jgi:dihydroflavonol-4-reductase